MQDAYLSARVEDIREVGHEGLEVAAPTPGGIRTAADGLSILRRPLRGPVARHSPEGRHSSSARSPALWFVAIALLGLVHILDHPSVLAAFSPHYAIVFLANHGFIGLLTIGAVFLAVTGAEALYADLGHFGRKPIVWLGWFRLARLALNYFGQGAGARPRGDDRTPVFRDEPRLGPYCRWWHLPRRRP